VYRRGAKSLPLGDFKRQALHAARLELLHPKTGKQKYWEAPLPKDMTALIARFRKTDAA
jgi:23S rRNA pseudouridine1911/1915/1917 synthase